MADTSVLTIISSVSWVYYTRPNSTNGTDSTRDSLCSAVTRKQRSDVTCEGNLTDCANRVERTEMQTNVLCDALALATTRDVVTLIALVVLAAVFYYIKWSIYMHTLRVANNLPSTLSRLLFRFDSQTLHELRNETARAWIHCNQCLLVPRERPDGTLQLDWLCNSSPFTSPRPDQCGDSGWSDPIPGESSIHFATKIKQSAQFLFSVCASTSLPEQDQSLDHTAHSDQHSGSHRTVRQQLYYLSYKAPVAREDLEEYIYFYENACYNEADFTQEEFKQFEEVLNRIIHAIGEMRDGTRLLQTMLGRLRLRP